MLNKCCILFTISPYKGIQIRGRGRSVSKFISVTAFLLSSSDRENSSNVVFILFQSISPLFVVHLSTKEERH